MSRRRHLPIRYTRGRSRRYAGDRGLDSRQTASILVEKIAALLGFSEGAAVALQLCREAMRDQKDAIQDGPIRHREGAP